MLIQPINSKLNTNVHYNQINQTGANNKQVPTFTGFFDLLSKQNKVRATLDSDIGIYTQKELAKLRENVTREVVEMFNQNATTGLSQRLDKILHSPFIDYKTNYFGYGYSSLADKISYNVSDSKGSELYRQFLLTSLAETMPMELIEKSRKNGLTCKNKALYHILDSYSKMDESTPIAAKVRQMVKRLTDNNIPIYNQNYLCAKGIQNNQPLMSKTYIDALNITPDSKVDVLYDNRECAEIFSLANEALGKPSLMEDPLNNLYTKFFIVDPLKVKNMSSTKGFGTTLLSINLPKMSLYDLAGLSKNKTIKEDIFDIIPWIQANKNRKIVNSRLYTEPDKTLYRLLFNAQTYHPELMSLDFLEKYIMSYDEKIPLANMFNEFPNSYLNNKNLPKELAQRIKRLKAENIPENTRRIEKLEEFYSFIKT